MQIHLFKWKNADMILCFSSAYIRIDIMKSSLNPSLRLYYGSAVNEIWAASWQNQQNDCAQQRLRSAWASAQSDQSLRCALNG